MGIVFEDLLIM